jgi:F-type H+-transporting ATPase subunit b
MLSRIARASAINCKPSVLFRAVSSSAAKQSDVKRYPHDAPERDFANYPPIRMPVQPGKVRLGFIPDEWFQFMYNKTGVTGPYILFWGAIATALSKEMFIPWVDTPEHLIFLGFVIATTKMYGSKIGAMLDKQVDQKIKAYEDELKESTKSVDAQIGSLEALKSLPEANKLIHDSKRDNVLLQLEAAYRQRMAMVHQEVKKRLDYQLAIQNIYKRVEREQAINFILDGVKKSIGPNQEKEAFQSALSQLKALSQQHAGSI